MQGRSLAIYGCVCSLCGVFLPADWRDTLDLLSYVGQVQQWGRDSVFEPDSRGVCALLANYSAQNRRCVGHPRLCVRACGTIIFVWQFVTIFVYNLYTHRGGYTLKSFIFYMQDRESTNLIKAVFDFYCPTGNGCTCRSLNVTNLFQN